MVLDQNEELDVETIKKSKSRLTKNQNEFSRKRRQANVQVLARDESLHSMDHFPMRWPKPFLLPYFWIFMWYSDRALLDLHAWVRLSHTFLVLWLLLYGIVIVLPQMLF